jgi:hypothetical protein
MSQQSWFRSQTGQEVCLFSKAPRTALVTTQPLAEWVLPDSFFEVKRPAHAANPFHPAENEWSYTTTAYTCLHNVHWYLTFCLDIILALTWSIWKKNIYQSSGGGGGAKAWSCIAVVQLKVGGSGGKMVTVENKQIVENLRRASPVSIQQNTSSGDHGMADEEGLPSLLRAVRGLHRGDTQK